MSKRPDLIGLLKVVEAPRTERDPNDGRGGSPSRRVWERAY